MAPCLPPISSPTATSIPIPTPLFTEITTTTITTTEPQVRVNVSDTGEPTSGTETLITSKPLSSPNSNESNTVLGVEDIQFDSFYYSPYIIQSDDDDDALVTKRNLKDLNEKLDRLISSSSSTPSETYSETGIKAMLATFVKEHDSSISKATKAIESSTSSFQESTIVVEESTNSSKKATENIKKLISDANIFQDSLHVAA